MFDIAGNKWFVGAPMPEGVGGPAVGVLNDLIYVIGGESDPYNHSPVQVYNPATNSWEKRDPLPPRYVSGGMAVYDNKLYIFGGQTDVDQYVRNVYYDPRAHSFSDVSGSPVLNLFPVGSLIQGKIYLAGGFTSGLYTTGVLYEFDPVSNVMTQLPTKLQYPRIGAAGISVENTFYVLGGSCSHGGSAVGINECLNMDNSRFYLIRKD
jgi:N-acetylneuraminic acid mutarotase